MTVSKFVAMVLAIASAAVAAIMLLAMALAVTVAAPGLGPAPSLAEELEAVICVDEYAAHRQALHDWNDRGNDAGSIRGKLAEQRWVDSFVALVACAARQEGTCGQVGRMYHDEITAPALSLSERNELSAMFFSCIHLGKPDG